MTGFVKLDCGMLNSTIWVDRPAREIFITALLMAEPREFIAEVPQIEVRTLNLTGWSAPAGWYGFVPSAGVGIVSRAGLDAEAGAAALERLGSPEPDSRSPAYDGRRMIRIDGGYLILNYWRFRERDYTAAERQRRFRDRKRGDDSHAVAPLHNGVTSRQVTHADAEAEDIHQRGRSLATRVPRSSMIAPTEFEQQVIEAYHSTLPDHPKVKVWTRKRRELLASRIADAMHRGKQDADKAEYWERFFSRVDRSDWLCGRGKTGHARDLTWMLDADNFAQVVEGCYGIDRGNGRAAGAYG